MCSLASSVHGYDLFNLQLLSYGTFDIFFLQRSLSPEGKNSDITIPYHAFSSHLLGQNYGIVWKLLSERINVMWSTKALKVHLLGQKLWLRLKFSKSGSNLKVKLSMSGCQKLWYGVKGTCIVRRNKNIKYESPTSSGSNIMTKPEG